jgi:hypothetical protein
MSASTMYSVILPNGGTVLWVNTRYCLTVVALVSLLCFRFSDLL